MAATYGYGGEFSSDEDIDRIEQQAERLTSARFDSYASLKPTRIQIEEAIETIRRSPIDQDVNFSDELLAGLLDFYKTQRGPIVDSTRNLYKKIILRLIRGEQPVSNGEAIDNNSNDNNNISTYNNNNIKRPQQVADSFSSDEDEPMPPVSNQDLGTNKAKLDGRTTHSDRIESMEVDSETSTVLTRRVENDDASSSDDDENTKESSEESSDSEELDLSQELDSTLVKPPRDMARPKSSSKAEPKQANESAPKQTALTQSILKEVTESKKKPYTRSQRVAATRASSMIKRKYGSEAATDDKNKDIFQTSSNRSVSKVKYLVVAIFIVLVAFLLFHFRSNLALTSDSLFSKKINF